MPVFNRDWELRRALSSLTSQTMNNFECLVVDDDSKMAIAPIVDDYDDRFIYLRTPKNAGPSAARLEALKAMRADIAFFLDSDNEVFPWTLHRAANLLDGMPDVDGVSGLYLFPDGLRVRVKGGTSVLTPEAYALGRSSPVDMVGAVRRNVVNEWLEKDPGYFSAEFHLWLTYHLHHEHLMIDEPWGRYHESNGPRVTTSSDPRKDQDVLRFVREHRPVLQSIPCTPLDRFLSAEWIRMARSEADTTDIRSWMKQRRIGRVGAVAGRVSDRLGRQRRKSLWI